MSFVQDAKILLTEPSRVKWETACMLLNLVKRDSQHSRKAYDQAVELSHYLHAWYDCGCAAVGRAKMLKMFGREELPFVKLKFKPPKERLRPSIPPTRKPLPAKDHPSYLELMRWLDTHENLRATFAYAPRFRMKNPIDLAFHIPYRGGALRGIPLADMYRGEMIDRTEWQTESGDWERDLIEDMVLFQIFHRPGIRTRTILRLNRRLAGFMRERTEVIVGINLLSHLIELRKARRIEENRPGRWRINPWWSTAVAKLSETWVERSLKA